MGAFDELITVSVNDHTETKTSGSHKDERGQWVNTKLTYLSWPFAWAEVKKRYPAASYTVWKDQLGRPYSYDEATGYMVYTTVTIEGITHEMWLPVMDGANKAMKAQPYKYSTRTGDKTVEAATMFDINKTLMRCLVKNLAMFGLGLYIYAGEDLPEGMDTKEEPKQAAAPAADQMQEAPKQAARKAPNKPKEEPKQETATTQQETPETAEISPAEALKGKVLNYIKQHYTSEQIKSICRKYAVTGIDDMTPAQCLEFEQLLKLSGRTI